MVKCPGMLTGHATIAILICLLCVKMLTIMWTDPLRQHMDKRKSHIISWEDAMPIFFLQPPSLVLT